MESSDIHMRVHAHKGDMRMERIYKRRDIHMENIHTRRHAHEGDIRTEETARHTHEATYI